MKIIPISYHQNGLRYTIRCAEEKDADQLSQIRLKIDGETSFFDRNPGEGMLTPNDFKQLIHTDLQGFNRLFLLAETETGQIIAFSRCEGSSLKRLMHKVEFGIGVLKDYWGYKVGPKLLQASLTWATENKMAKMTLSVIETNEKAIKLYKRFGFEVEGILKKDKLLEDGEYYSTIIMSRFLSE
ncbi:MULTISPECIES: GNAT family N-acetyltransferase [Bacillaceae]|jgi:RimJ/RimL family protein N-acetyltransferase|uniref:GNAT family protein n=1 Tax=Niallia hominis TaxID=3133173 RepID=A0ABV1F4J0_9BACI|nr:MULTISPECIES: GNAT family protein [Bacillaceae]MCF2647462.1 GNAT family N-acetyltransferase [Niallia circulans]MCM3364592.1 GNAT family N-acetyltransferase [Niallia sp. MER TA 168]CAI9385909.1 L-amino acid N-acetyltransferase AaaT [Bacillus sp. T2.9-1]